MYRRSHTLMYVLSTKVRAGQCLSIWYSTEWKFSLGGEFISLGTLFKRETHLIRCMAGQIKRNFGSKDILKLVVNKILSVKSDATHSRLICLLQAVRFLYLYEINKLRGIMKFAINGSFTGSVISKENPVMLGHDDDDETRHVSYTLRKFPSILLNAQSHFASLLDPWRLSHELRAFLWTRIFFFRCVRVAWHEQKKTAVNIC